MLAIGMLLLPAGAVGTGAELGAGTVTETVAVGPGTLAETASYHGEEEAKNHTCSGFSPAMPACTTGVHTMLERSLYMSISANGSTDAIIENRIEYVNESGLQAFVFRCTIVDASVSCDAEGEVPPAGTEVLHDCRTYDRETGLPGGSGSWSCTFRPAYWK